MNTLLDNIKNGEIRPQVSDIMSGYKLAKKIASDRASETGNNCYVIRITDSIDIFNNADRHHYSFDVIEVI